MRLPEKAVRLWQRESSLRVTVRVRSQGTCGNGRRTDLRRGATVRSRVSGAGCRCRAPYLVHLGGRQAGLVARICRGDLDRRGSVDEGDALRIPRTPRTDAREPQPVWDTRIPGGGWPGRRDRLAFAVGAALLVAAILAAVTGKVLASGPPGLPESSPTADHSKIPTQASSLEPVDPRSLFLDLPDPEVSAIRNPETAVAREAAARPARRAAAKEVSGVRSRGEGPSGRDARPRSPGVTPAVSEAEEVAEHSPPVRSVEPGSGEASDLLDDPDCRFSEVARRDLRAGIVDEYLISALQAVCREHSIYVNVFKTGHTFGAGLEEGPTIPVGYGNAGGYPNTHYFGRAADI